MNAYAPFLSLPEVDEVFGVRSMIVENDVEIWRCFTVDGRIVTNLLFGVFEGKSCHRFVPERRFAGENRAEKDIALAFVIGC